MGNVPINKKVPIHKICPTCKKDFFVKPSLDRVIYCSVHCARVGRPSNWSGKKASPETKLKQRIAKLGIRGPAHPLWRGGTGTLRQIDMRRDEYKQWRKQVFERDNYTCQLCGVHGCYLEADHIRPWVSYPELRYDVTNGRTLCRPCHMKQPTWGIKAKKMSLEG